MPPQPHTAERIYYDEQQLLEFTAVVTEIRELIRIEGRPLFQVALDRTAFYPTGGGQPHDIGTLTATARSGAVLEAPVTDVTEDAAGEVWHTTAKPLQPGTIVTGRIDADRRRDHMQQHSGQHLLSAIAAKELGALTVSFHLGEQASTIDLTLPVMDESQIKMLERLVNDAVAQSLPMSQEHVSQQEAQRLLAAGELRKLPERAGDIRVVSIAGLNRNACGGTHVHSTSEIGPVFLRRTEKVRGNTRLTFLCGTRAITAARRDWKLLTGLALSLSTAPDELAERMERMQAEIRAMHKQLRSLPLQTPVRN